jgi:hypothetical protein
VHFARPDTDEICIVPLRSKMSYGRHPSPKASYHHQHSEAKPPEAFGEGWSGRRDSNSRPPAPKAGALPDCATPRLFLDDAVDSRSLHCTAREKARFVVAAKKEPHQPFGQLLQRRSDLLRHLPKLSTLREVYQPVASPLEKLPEGVMRSLPPTGPPS